jgi:hypothetical protein
MANKNSVVTALVALGLLITSSFALADVLIIGNNAAFGNGPIQTYSFTTGALVAQFVPDGAVGTNDGRGIAVANGLVYYTELSTSLGGGIGPSDGIHLAPFNGGAGGSDITVLPNPNPLFGIQDLAYSQGYLFALTGYSDQDTGIPTVYKLDPSTGTVVNSVVIQGADGNSDGFTVLPDGNFFINCGDACNTYSEYSSVTGLPTGLTFTIPLSNTSTGVDLLADNLFFATDFDGFTETDLLGNLVAQTLVGAEFIEDIAVFIPEPSSFLLLAASLIFFSKHPARTRGRSAVDSCERWAPGSRL